MDTEIILDIILVFIGLYLALFKSYFHEKGKNIATSEDVEKLTLKVESVKQQFIEKNANLKAKLDLLTNLQISHKNDQRTAIIDFHNKLGSWIGLLTESTPSLVDNYDNTEIQNKIYSYDFAYREVLNAQSILELFIDDKKLIELVHNLKVESIKNLTPHPTKYLLYLKHNNFEIGQLDQENNLNVKNEKHKDLIDKRKGLHVEYSEKMIKGFEAIIPYKKEYLNYTRKYFSEIPIE